MQNFPESLEKEQQKENLLDETQNRIGCSQAPQSEKV